MCDEVLMEKGASFVGRVDISLSGGHLVGSTVVIGSVEVSLRGDHLVVRIFVVGRVEQLLRGGPLVGSSAGVGTDKGLRRNVAGNTLVLERSPLEADVVLYPESPLYDCELASCEGDCKLASCEGDADVTEVPGQSSRLRENDEVLNSGG